VFGGVRADSAERTGRHIPQANQNFADVEVAAAEIEVEEVAAAEVVAGVVAVEVAVVGG
jgi:hypothetical protein